MSDPVSLEERIGSTSLQTLTAPRGAFRGFAFAVRGVWQRRELLGLLVRREIKSRYKNSSLGAVWSLIRPLALLLVYYVAIGEFIGAARTIPMFAIFIFCGLTAWSLYSDIIGSMTTSIISNGGLIKKVYLPREIFPLASVGSALFNFMMQFAVLIAAVLLLGQWPTIDALWLIPTAFITLVTFATAVGLMLSALNVYMRDVQYLVEIVLMVMFWASPIVYSFTFVHERLETNFAWLEQLYLANPATVIVLAFQKGLWAAGSAEGSGQVFPDDLMLRLGITFLVSLVILWFSQRVFARMEGSFAQEL